MATLHCYATGLLSFFSQLPEKQKLFDMAKKSSTAWAAPMSASLIFLSVSAPNTVN